MGTIAPREPPRLSDAPLGEGPGVGRPPAPQVARDERLVARHQVLGRHAHNLRTRFKKIGHPASLQPWPRLFHNLRASCATDFAQRLPNHEAARYLGHSPLIAASHYLQPSDHNFRSVAGEGPCFCPQWAILDSNQ